MQILLPQLPTLGPLPTCPCPPCDPPVPPGFQRLLVCFSRPEMTSPSTGCPGPLPGPLGGSSLVPSLPPSDLDFWACACTSLAQSWCTEVGVWQLPVCGLEGEEPHLYRAGQAEAAFPAQKGGSPSLGVLGCLSQSGKSQCLPGARNPPTLITHQRPWVNSS